MLSQHRIYRIGMFTVLSLLMSVSQAFGQCPVNAGSNQELCDSGGGSVIITQLQADALQMGFTGQWTILSGTGGSFPNPVNPSTAPNAVFHGQPGETYILRWEITDGVTSCSDEVTITMYENPGTANAGPDQTGAVNGVCGTVGTLAADPVPGAGTGTWSIVAGDGNGYFGATPGTLTSTDPTADFNGTAGQAYTLRWTVSNGNCPVTQDEMDIEFFLDEAANAGADQDVCADNTNLAAMAPTSGTGMWSIISGAGGSFGDATSATSSFMGTRGVSYTLRWTTTNGPCSNSDDVVVTLFEDPTPSAAGADQDVCDSTTTLAANTPTVGTGMWSVVAGVGGSFGDALDPASSFTGTRGESYTLRWTIGNGPCPVSTDDVVINLFEDVVPNAGSDQNVCGMNTFLGATLSTGTGTWSILSGAGGSVTTPSDPTSAFSGNFGVTYTLQWTETNGPCSDSDTVEITFFDNPTPAAAGADQDLCADNGVLAANAAAGFMETGTWSVVAGAGGSFTDVNDPTTTFTGTRGVTYTLRWTISNGVCPISSDDVVINLFEDVVPNAGADQDVCGTDTILAAVFSTGMSGSWSIISGAGGSFGDANSATSTFMGSTEVEYVLEWTEDNGPCSDTDQVTIKFFSNPTSNAGTDQTGAMDGVCGDTTTLAGNTPGAVAGFEETGTWSEVAGDGNAVFVDANDPMTSVTGTRGQLYTFRWTVSNGVCPDATDDVAVEFYEEVTTADAGTNQVVCYGPVGGAPKMPGIFTTMQANAPGAQEEGMWTIVSADPVMTGSFDDPTNPMAVFTGEQDGSYELQWTISPVMGTSPCAPSSDTLTVDFPENPPTATATDQTECSDTVTLDGNDPLGRIIEWSIISGDGNGYFDGTPGTLTSSNNMAMFTGTRETSYTLRYTIFSGTLCPDSATDVTITLVDDPTPANAGPDQTGAGGVCGDTTNLAGNTVTVGTGAWSITGAADGMGVLTDPSDPTTSFSGTPGQTYTLTWTTSNAPCVDSTDTVDIEFFAEEIADAGTDEEVCTANDLVTTESSMNTPVALNDNAMTTDTIMIADPGAGTYPNGATITGLRVMLDIAHTATSDLSITLESPNATTVTLIDAMDTCLSIDGNLVVTFNDAATNTLCNGNIAPGTIAGMVQPAEMLSAFNGEGIIGTWTLTVTDANTGETGTLNDFSLWFETESEAQTTLTASAPSLGSGEWTIVSGDGNGYFGMTPGTVTSANPTDTFSGTVGQSYELQWAVTGADPCPPTDDTVTILFVPAGGANAGADQTVCVDATPNATLEGNAPAVFGGTGQWTITAGDGNGYFSGSPGQFTSSNPTDIFTGTPGQTYTLQWALTGGTCGDTMDSVDISFVNAPSTANAGTDFAVCLIGVTERTETLAAAVPTSGTGRWSIRSASPALSGMEAFSDINSPTSTFTGTVGTIYVLEWRVGTGGNCAASTDTITLEFRSLPIASAGPDQSVCSNVTNLTGNLGETIMAPVTGTWTIISGDGNGVIADPNSQSSNFSGTRNTVYVLRWTLEDGICTTFDQVEITFLEQPVATATDQQVCDNTVTLDGGHNGAVGVLPIGAMPSWSIVSTSPGGNGNGVFGSTSGATSTTLNDTFSGDFGVVYTLRLTLTSPPCNVSTIDIDVEFVEPPDVPEAGMDQEDCGGVTAIENFLGPVRGGGGLVAEETFTLDNFGTITDLNLYLDFQATDASQLSITLTHVSTGTTVEVISNPACAMVDSTYTLDDESGTAFTCLSGVYQPANALSAFDGEDIAGDWTLTVNDTGGGAGFVGNSWGLIINPVTFNVAATPDPLTVGTATGSWSFDFDFAVRAGGFADTADRGVPPLDSSFFGYFTTVAGTDSTSPANSGFATTFTAAAGAPYILTFTTENGPCTEEDSLSIETFVAPSVAVAGMDQEICGDMATLAATAPSEGTGTWTVVSSMPLNAQLPNTPDTMFDDANSPTAVFTGSRGYTYTLEWSVETTNCNDPANVDSVVITLAAENSPADAGMDQAICGDTALLAGNDPLFGTGTWSITNVVALDASLPPNPGGEMFSDVNSGTSMFTGNLGYSYTLTWTHDNPPCASTDDTVVIDLYREPSNADAGMDASYCLSDGLNLAGNAPAIGTGTWSVVSGPNGAVTSFTDANDPTTAFITDREGDYVLAWTITNGACTPSEDMVMIEANDLSIDTLGSFGQGLDPVTLEATAVCTTDPTTIEWFNNDTGASFGVGNNPVTLPSLLTETTVFRVEVTDSSRAVVTEFVTVLVSDNPDVSDPNGDGCNTVEDLVLACSEWLSESSVYDADNNGQVDVRDFAFINTSEEGTACDNP